MLITEQQIGITYPRKAKALLKVFVLDNPRLDETIEVGHCLGEHSPDHSSTIFHIGAIAVTAEREGPGK